MLLKIEKRGRRYVITNNPPFKYKKFDVLINENNIINPSMKENTTLNNPDLNQKIMEIRNKYPELKALDDLTSGWIANEPDSELLDHYFEQRAKDEGLI